MAQWLRQQTAGTIAFGPFVGTSDGFTPGTALTISQADIQLSKNGAAFAQVSGTANLTHMANGYYALPLGTADTGTLGRLRITSAESAALPVWQDFIVVPANIYDSLISGSDFQQVDAVQWNGTAVVAIPTAAENAAGLLDLSHGIETGHTPRQALRTMYAALAGKLSGAATTTITIRDVTDTRNQIVATVDANGNRGTVSLTEA